MCIRKLFRSGSVLLFNGIINFMVYLMPNPSLQMGNSGTIKSIAKGIKRSMLFPKVLVETVGHGDELLATSFWTKQQTVGG